MKYEYAVVRHTNDNKDVQLATKQLGEHVAEGFRITHFQMAVEKDVLWSVFILEKEKKQDDTE